MKDPHTNSHPTQGTKSPSDPRANEAKAQPVENDKESASKALPPDPIDLTDRSALISFVQAEAKRIPDIRQDRVEQIRAALQSRNYHISSDLLADKIIQDILLDHPSAQD